MESNITQRRLRNLLRKVYQDGKNDQTEENFEAWLEQELNNFKWEPVTN